MGGGIRCCYISVISSRPSLDLLYLLYTLLYSLSRDYINSSDGKDRNSRTAGNTHGDRTHKPGTSERSILIRSLAIITSPRAMRLDPLTVAGAIHQPVLVSVGQLPPVLEERIGHAGAGYGVTLGPPHTSGPILGLDGPRFHALSVAIIWPILGYRPTMTVIPVPPQGFAGWGDRFAFPYYPEQ